MKTVLAAAAVAIASCVTGAAAEQTGVDLRHTLARAGAQVEAFFKRAQSLVCLEVVTMQPLNSGFSADGFGRTVESELRLSWDPAHDAAATEAQTKRAVLKVNGRPPRDDDRRRCTTPEQTDSETQPLSMLLPQQLEKYQFSVAGPSRVDGRATIMVDFREVAPTSVVVEAVDGLDDCIRYDLKGGQRGRLWIDADTFDVLRLDQRITGMVELRLPRVLARRPGSPLSLVLEREDTSIRFGRIAFTEPDESLVLPLTSSSLRVMRGGGASHLRTTTRYDNYRRFLTGGRMIGEAN
jgi:hypothetical protein